MIKPTVGRIVWFYSSKAPDTAQAAMVARVWDERRVNLMVVEPDGTTRGQTSVQLLQDDDKPDGGAFWCAWMPYQIGQAAKHAAADAKLAAQEGS